MALIAITVYVVTRAVLLHYAEYDGVDRISAGLLFFAELFIIVHGIGYTINIYRAYKERGRAGNPELAGWAEGPRPSVAVLVAARHEPAELLEETLTNLQNINYPNKQIFLLDDSSVETYKNEAEELCGRLGVTLFRREIRHGAKAGIINDVLKGLDHKYVAVFDADQNPMPEFLNKLIPLMENDEKLAFVQTPQFYTNVQDSPVARGASFQQAVFYEYICEGKSSQEAMFCCGTNIVFRRQALEDVGGLDEDTVTEDFATSLKLHRRKWRSLYYNHVSAFGMAPNDLAAYFKQQYRWANGTITVLKRTLWAFLTNPLSLKFKQWWEYFLSGSFYMVGFSFFLLIMFPVFYLLFDVPSFFARPEVYALTFVPYILLSMSVFYFVLKGRNYSIKDLFLGQLMGVISFSVYLRAFVFSLFGVKTTFGITQKRKGHSRVPLIVLWPQISVLTINYIALVWGVNRYIYEGAPAILINAFWVTFHILVLCSVFYFNGQQACASCKSLVKGVSFEYRTIPVEGDIKALGRGAWKTAFVITLPEQLENGSALMCKLKRGDAGEAIVLDASVIASRKTRGRYRTELGVLNITSEDKTRLEEEFLR